MSEKNGRIYFKVYNPETKKQISLVKTISDYKNRDDCIADIRRIQTYHRKKNKEFRENKKKHLLVPIPEIEQDSDIDLNLDSGTGNTTVLFGSSKQGKTTVMLHLIAKYYQSNANQINSLFSVNDHDKRFTNFELKTSEFNKKAENYIKLQKFINSKQDNKWEFCNIFDDIINGKHKNIINELIMTYRNSNISTVMCLQYTFLLSKMNRANVNNILIFGSNSVEASEDIIKTFLCKYFDRMDIADHYGFYKKMTKDHGFIYIHNATDEISFHKLSLKFNNKTQIP